MGTRRTHNATSTWLMNLAADRVCAMIVGRIGAKMPGGQLNRKGERTATAQEVIGVRCRVRAAAS
jgi:hypothetical protein